MKQRLVFIDVIKVIAIILITNSHFKPILEGGLSQFASGGALGCSLFFFCSGYTGMLGSQRPFFKDIFHKIIRIYPTIWIFLLVIGQTPSFDKYVLLEQFWFLQALLIFYVLFWFIRKFLNKPLFLILLIVCCLIISTISYFNYPHAEWMIDYPRNHFITFPYYFSIMLLGALCNRINYIPKVINNQILRFLLVIGAMVIVYGFKFILQRKWIPNDAQLLFPLLLILACTTVYIALYQMQHCYKFMTFIAALTLEIYIVQIACINFCVAYPFPLRLLMVVIMIFFGAWLLQISRNFIVKMIEQFVKRCNLIIQDMLK